MNMRFHHRGLGAVTNLGQIFFQSRSNILAMRSITHSTIPVMTTQPIFLTAPMIMRKKPAAAIGTSKAHLLDMDNMRFHHRGLGAVSSLISCSSVLIRSWACPSWWASCIFSLWSSLTKTMAESAFLSSVFARVFWPGIMGGTEVIRYVAPCLPGANSAWIFPSLMYRLTWRGDTPRAWAAWLIVNPSGIAKE